MRVALHISNADLAGAFHSYIERRLRFALSRFGGRVGQVTVRLAADGPATSRCRISAEILPCGHVVLEDSDPDLFIAIDCATGRIGRLFGRELERRRDGRVGRDSIRIAA